MNFKKANTATTPAQETTDSQVWINVGYINEDGDFVSPFKGVPVDTAVAPKFGGQQNVDMFTAIQELGSELGEGESQIINLQVQVYRRKGETKAVAKDVASLKVGLVAKA